MSDEANHPALSPDADISRREALVALSALPFALRVDAGSIASRAWQFVARQRSTATDAYSPRFFTAKEWLAVQALVDDVIPRDERSGSATEAGVPEFMDFIMIDQPNAQSPMRVGLGWIDDECQRRFGKAYAGCSQQQRSKLLDDIAWPDRVPVGLGHGAIFFTAFRDLTASGFWSSRIGVADLQYIGNAFVRDWQGCPAPALAKLGVKY
jgi:gluconate 2-dehydrogenase gamma chain